MRNVPMILAAVLILAGCGGTSRHSAASTTAVPRPPGAPIRVSSDFGAGAPIPRIHTCDGRDVSPPVHVSGLPARTREVVLVMTDPDAPGGEFIHWVIAHLAPTGQSVSLTAGAEPAGVVLGRNSFGSLGYRGPCPPTGPAHHYHLTVDALDQPSALTRGFPADAVAGLPVIGQGTLIGTYARR